MSKVIYQCTALNGVNKVGDLQRDNKGYFELVLGALNAYNAHGWYYSYEHAKNLFDSSAELMRRIGTGRLRGETGHPRMQPGMSQMQWFNRVNDIYEPNICCHFASVQLSHDGHKDAQGRPVILIMARVKASGANSAWLDKQFLNSEEDVCFSIRSFTQDEIIGGRKTKMLKKIVTWDNVNEPGIGDACKYRTPSLESLGLTMDKEADLEMAFYTDSLRSEIETNTNTNPACGVTMESNTQLLSLVAEIERPIKVYVPASMRW